VLKKMHLKALRHNLNVKKTALKDAVVGCKTITKGLGWCFVLNLRRREDQVSDLDSCHFFVSSSRGDPSFSSAKKEASAELAP